METKFTPGPWRMSESKTVLDDFVCNIHQDDNADYTPNYSDVATTIVGELKEIQLANAHLIAASPKMYKMLERVCNELIPIAGETEKQESFRFEILDLLAEARGEDA